MWQQLSQQEGFPCTNYWESSGQAEIDFLLQAGTSVVPVEAKAGEHVRSRSLSVFRDRFTPSFSIRLSTRNFGSDDGLFSVPLYAAWLIAGITSGK